MKESKILIQANLKAYFYKQLYEINKNLNCPVPEFTLRYVSETMEKMALSQNYFETSEGKISEKVLGVKLLESASLEKNERKLILKDIGDTALLTSSYFFESINKKLLDERYYIQLGKTAYMKANELIPRSFDIPNFFEIIATSFERLVEIINSYNRSNDQKLMDKYLLDLPAIKAS
jgi:hypothetical protein